MMLYDYLTVTSLQFPSVTIVLFTCFSDPLDWLWSIPFQNHVIFLLSSLGLLAIIIYGLLFFPLELVNTETGLYQIPPTCLGP